MEEHSRAGASTKMLRGQLFNWEGNLSICFAKAEKHYYCECFYCIT